MHRKTLAGVPLRPDGTLPPLAGCDPAGEATLKDKLKRIEEDLSGLRDQRAEKAKERDEAKAAFASADSYDTESAEFKAAEEKVREVGEIDERMQAVQAAQLGVLKMLGQSDPEAVKADRRDREPVGDPTDPRGGGEWSSKGLFTEEIIDRLRRASATKSHVGPIELGQVVDRDTFKADVTGTSNMRRGQFAGVATQLRRRFSVLDLIPTSTTDGNLVPYVQEGGTFTAAETAESAAKPESGLTFTDASAPVQTVAAWQKVRKQSLADIAAMQGIIDDRLRYAVTRRLEDQIVAGNGTDPNLQGVLNTSGIGSVTYTTGDVLNDKILAGLTQVMLADAEPTGIVVHPSDWEAILTEKASGSGEYLAGDNFGGPFAPLSGSMWGVPLIPSRVISAGTALVGDWALGAQLFIREGVQVLLSDSDQDDFIKNRVTILAELRAALAVWRPAAFSKVALA